MKLDIRPLLAGDKLMKFEYELLLDTPEDPRGFFSDASFPSPLKVVGDITNTAGYMRMRVALTVDYETSCARCLSPISGSFSLDLEKTVAPRDILADLPEEKLDDYVIVDDGFIDIDELLRDQMELEFPSRFFCREDCRGLCQRCGKNLNEGKCGCPEKEIDPRLAPLQAILDRMKAENQE
ncbi:MAG: DUF177 domain-containing protein [Clostridia bacterium]|nr:DUF177 domain-containing protein [Clostridia bacterium]